MLGIERTMDQDPTFAFRILVDIAIKALSAAINDPTTAVLAIDQLHRLLRMVGLRDLRGEELRDEAGELRLVFRTPNWEDYVHLSCTEIRHCGAGSFQVMRRMRAMLENLTQTLPPHRHAELRQQLDLLDRTIVGHYEFPDDRALAPIPDPQGLGGAVGVLPIDEAQATEHGRIRRREHDVIVGAGLRDGAMEPLRVPQLASDMVERNGNDDLARSEVRGDGARLRRACGSRRLREHRRPGAANVDEIANLLRQSRYDMELLISFGTSKGGSAGHLALAIRDEAHGDDMVYSANFYADRKPEHEGRFYTDDLMVRIPKNEYLFGTVSSLGDKASFGLDFGEIYKRSVIGVRVYGVPAGEKEALAAFFQRVNDDYHDRAQEHGLPRPRGQVRLPAVQLRQDASASGFKLGAGYKDLEVESARASRGTEGGGGGQCQHSHRDGDEAPDEWNARGYGLDVVLYRKYAGSTYVDPHEEEKVAFKDLPTGSLPCCRATSARSRDSTRTRQPLRDVRLLQHRQVPRAVNGATKLPRSRRQGPMAYPEGRRACHAERRGGQRELPSGLPFGGGGRVEEPAGQALSPTGRGEPSSPTSAEGSEQFPTRTRSRSSALQIPASPGTTCLIRMEHA